MAVSSIRLFDAHCHLQDARFGAGELDDVLSRSRAAGVRRMAVNGCCVEDWPLVHAIAAAHGEMVVANYGLHPWWVGRQPDHWLDLLRQRLLASPGAGLGECGLDRSRRAPPCPFEEQVSVFKAQLLLAQELQRPLSVHCVRAVGHLREALAEVRPTAPVLLHSWCGAAEDVRAIATAHPSAFFSVSGGISALPPAKAIRTLRAIPADRLLLETDAPDGGLRLGPAWLEALPGFARSAPPCPERQEPAGLRRMLALVAAARGEGEVGLAALTWRNACAVFAGLPAAR
ncbi:hypothetical protein ACKKBG_A10295 [Auxenochlorella protothecoides x Auxenochlorella symbiontica]